MSIAGPAVIIGFSDWGVEVDSAQEEGDSAVNGLLLSQQRRVKRRGGAAAFKELGRRRAQRGEREQIRNMAVSDQLL